MTKFSYGDLIVLKHGPYWQRCESCWICFDEDHSMMEKSVFKLEDDDKIMMIVLNQYGAKYVPNFHRFSFILRVWTR